jgi:hypothetical protein
MTKPNYKEDKNDPGIQKIEMITKTWREDIKC